MSDRGTTGTIVLYDPDELTSVTITLTGQDTVTIGGVTYPLTFATDNALLRADTPSGIQQSNAILDDDGNLTITGDLSADNSEIFLGHEDGPSLNVVLNLSNRLLFRDADDFPILWVGNAGTGNNTAIKFAEPTIYQTITVPDTGGSVGTFAVSASGVMDLSSAGDITLNGTEAELEAGLMDVTNVITNNDDTDDIPEGVTNLFYTDARVDSHLSGGEGIGYSAGTISLDDPYTPSDGTWNVTGGLNLTNNLTAGDAAGDSHSITGDVTLNGEIYAYIEDGFSENIFTVNSSGSSVHRPIIDIYRSRGSNSVPSLVSSGDWIGSIAFRAHDGTGYALGASIDVLMDAATGAGDTPTHMAFKTTPDGSSSRVEQMRIDNDGDIYAYKDQTYSHGVLGLVGYHEGAVTDPYLYANNAGDNFRFSLPDMLPGSVLGSIDVKFYAVNVGDQITITVKSMPATGSSVTVTNQSTATYTTLASGVIVYTLSCTDTIAADTAYWLDIELVDVNMRLYSLDFNTTERVY